MSPYPLVLPRAIFPNNPKQKEATHCWVCEPFGERDPLTRQKKISAKVAIEGSTLAAKWMLNSYLTRYQKSENTRLEKNIFSSLFRPYSYAWAEDLDLKDAIIYHYRHPNSFRCILTIRNTRVRWIQRKIRWIQRMRELVDMQ